ncbi:hypothetical protein ACFE04_031116 [Oxalis oulophora]
MAACWNFVVWLTVDLTVESYWFPSRKGKALPPLLGKQRSTNDYQSLQLGFRFGFDVIRVGLNLMKVVWWMTSGVDGGLADCDVENDGGYGVLCRNQWCCY